TLLLAVYSFQACNTSSNNNDSVDSAQNMNEMKDSDNNMGMNNNDTAMKGTMTVSEDDADFMVKAAAGGMTEIEMSKLGQQKATAASVKSFADMMVTDHTKAAGELKSLAARKNVTLPASMDNDQQKDYNDLSQKSGKDFDKAYINMMVADHKHDVDMFDKCTKKDNSDADLKAWAQNTLPTLQKHLDAVKKIDDMMKK
ncbi:MAG: DUF4142 domain-containing protein, partial [Parafilimonas sp.]